MRPCPPRRLSRRAQRGISLVVVMIMLLLSVMLAVGAARTALLNEALTGNLSDEQRALLAAEALLADAQETVIKHIRETTNVLAPDKLPNSQGMGFLPVSFADFTDFSLALENANGSATPCVKGYCTFSPVPGAPVGDWWADPAVVDLLWPLGASFGEYTAAASAAGNVGLGNARFWVEVYPYSKTLDTQAVQPPDTHPFVFQITVIARGLKAGTQVVLRSVIVRSPKV